MEIIVVKKMYCDDCDKEFPLAAMFLLDDGDLVCHDCMELRYKLLHTLLKRDRIVDPQLSRRPLAGGKSPSAQDIWLCQRTKPTGISTLLFLH